MSVAIEGATLEFRPTSLMASLDLAEDAEIRRLSAEQSNSSLIVGDTLVMKVVRRVSPGIHPEGEITRYLTERGFGNTAPLYGEIVRMDRTARPTRSAWCRASSATRAMAGVGRWTSWSARWTRLSTTDGEAETRSGRVRAYNVFAAADRAALG